MPNIATVLKTEISRIARKEVRAEAKSLKKAATLQRSEIANLKRRVHELERQLKALSKAAGRSVVTAAAPASESEGDGERGGLRFRAEGMASNRKRLGLSAADFGLLVGATGQSVYSWEQGKSKPRAKNLTAIASLRGIGRREVAKRLEALQS